MDNAEHIERLEIAIAELDDAVAVLADLPEPLAIVTKARGDLRDRLAKLGGKQEAV